MLKDLVSITHLTPLDVQQIIDDAWVLEHDIPIDEWKLPNLEGHPAAIMMFEESTRTRHSFDLALKYLGMNVLHFYPDASSMKTKGEGLFETLDTMDALGCKVIVMRTPTRDDPERFAVRLPGVHVINAGDGANAHPTQALIDLATILHNIKDDDDTYIRLDGIKIVFLGDVAHSRVANSDAYLFKHLGAEVVAACPHSMFPRTASLFEETVWEKNYFEWTHHIESVLPGAHVIIPLRIQYERHFAKNPLSAAEYSRDYCLTTERLAMANPRAIVMAPGPINIGVEIARDVAYGPQSRIKQQVQNSVSIRAAVIQALTYGELHGTDMDGGLWG